MSHGDENRMPVGDLEWDEKPGRPARTTRVYRCGPLRRDGAPSSVWLYAESDAEPMPVAERAAVAEGHRMAARAHNRAQAARRRAHDRA